MPRPTSVQKQALLAAIDSGNRCVSTATYAARTIDIMERNRWIELSSNRTLMRVLPEGARVLQLFAVGDRYAREDALANNPVARHTEQVVQTAVELGFEVAPSLHDDATVVINARHLASLLNSAELVNRWQIA